MVCFENAWLSVLMHAAQCAAHTTHHITHIDNLQQCHIIVKCTLTSDNKHSKRYMLWDQCRISLGLSHYCIPFFSFSLPFFFISVAPFHSLSLLFIFPIFQNSFLSLSINGVHKWSEEKCSTSNQRTERENIV